MPASSSARLVIAAMKNLVRSAGAQKGACPTDSLARAEGALDEHLDVFAQHRRLDVAAFDQPLQHHAAQRADHEFRTDGGRDALVDLAARDAGADVVLDVLEHG